MKSKLLGRYRLGRGYVRVLITGDGSGCFYVFPDDQSIPTIEIGLNDKFFERALEVAMHEAMELCFHVMGCQLEPAGNQTLSNDGYVFHCTHPQFSEAVSRVACFIAHIYCDLQRAHRKYHRQKKG